MRGGRSPYAGRSVRCGRSPYAGRSERARAVTVRGTLSHDAAARSPYAGRSLRCGRSPYAGRSPRCGRSPYAGRSVRAPRGSQLEPLARGSQLGRSLRPADGRPSARAARSSAFQRCFLGARPLRRGGSRGVRGCGCRPWGRPCGRRRAVRKFLPCGFLKLAIGIFLGCLECMTERTTIRRGHKKPGQVFGRDRSHTVIIRPPFGGETGPPDLQTHPRTTAVSRADLPTLPDAACEVTETSANPAATRAR